MEQLGIHGDAPVKREEPAPSANPKRLEVTQAAVVQIAKLAAKRRAEGKQPAGLRIGLRGGGCDGFSYTFEWSDKPPSETRDHVLEFDAPADYGEPKVRVFVDKKSMLYLQGTTLNFVTGLMGHGFKFENPNVKGSCGCGESVQF
jgi:iron-sulfur cluster assembly protein